MQSVEPFFEAGRIGWTVISIAAILLVLSVVILARLRWTQSRPFTTCVALSVVAHILLVSSAYLIRVFDVPAPVGEVAISIFFDDQAPSSNAKDQPILTETSVAQSHLVPQPIEQSHLDDITEVADTDVLPSSQIEPEVAPTVELSRSPTIADAPHLELPAGPETEDTVAGGPQWDQTPPIPTVSPVPAHDQPKPELSANSEDANAVAKDEGSGAEDNEEESQASSPLKVDSMNPAATVRKTESEWGATTSEKLNAPDNQHDDDAFVAESTPRVEIPGPDPTRPSQSPEAGDHDSPAVDGNAWRSVSSSAAPARSAEDIPERFQNRIATNRAEVTRRKGGNADTEEAVRLALRWLARNQNVDGRWIASKYGAGQGRLVDGHFRGPAGIQADTGITGLALLAFLGDGHSHENGKYKKVVAKALEFLMSAQASDGNLFGSATNYARMYCHGIATMALNEAYAMTKDNRLLPYVKQAVQYSLAAQSVQTGGWRYHPGDDGDTSQFGWQLMALLTADEAGISIPETSRNGMYRYLASVSVGGLAGYRAGQGISRPMTAEALACRTFLNGDFGATPETSRLRSEASNYLRQELPGRGAPNFYYWYYATLALCRSDSECWPEWNQALQRELLKLQTSFGVEKGSWPATTVWGGHGGRVYTTALGAMCLEVYYRY